MEARRATAVLLGIATAIGLIYLARAKPVTPPSPPPEEEAAEIIAVEVVEG